MNAVCSYAKSFLIALVLCIGAQVCVAANFGQSNMTGLVINQTGSHQAQNFYQAFCLAWHEQRNASQFNLVLKETHSARYGRQVQILYDRQVAYIATLPNGNPQWHLLAEQAATNAIQRIETMVLQEAAYTNPDLAVDEI